MQSKDSTMSSPDHPVTLQDIAHGRSGDKGNHANIAVIGYTPAAFAWLCEHLTEEIVKNYFAPLKPTRVVRYEAPNLLALNFMLHDVLAGGASRSLRSDNQGKTLALALSRLPLPALPDATAMLPPRATETTGARTSVSTSAGSRPWG